MGESGRWVVSTPRLPHTTAPSADQDAYPSDEVPLGQLDDAAADSPASALEWVWIGAHGGAGVSTLQRAAGVGTDLGQQWPPVQAPGNRVLLVARTHAAGLAAVRRVLGTRGPDLLHGVVLVADAPGRLPRELRQQIRVLSGAAPRLWQVPWVEAWRSDATAAPPRQIVHLLTNLTTPH